MSNYIVYGKNDYVIYGAGPTVDAAWDEVKRDVLTKNPVLNYDDNSVSEDEVFEKYYAVLPATDALMDMLQAYGGNIPWTRDANGVATTEN